MPCIGAIAAGAVSAFGIGEAAFHVAIPAEPARIAWKADAALQTAGLRRPFAARAPEHLPLAAHPGGPANASDIFPDRAAALLACALDQVVCTLDRTRPRWRDERIAIALGTSSGGMLSAEQFFHARAQIAAGSSHPDLGALAERATYFAPVREVLTAYDLHKTPRQTLLLAACAASTIGVGIGMRWLDRNAADIVIAGGFDGISLFVAAGFEALRATTASSPNPFRIGRDGMCLGEGAALLALVRRGNEQSAAPLFFVQGFGASTDGVHITAPDATGSGLARAATAAFADAGTTTVDLVSAHATATPYNDSMESKAILKAVGDAPVVHPFKAQIGHTLGAAGVLETLAAADALIHQVAPAAAGAGPLDPEAPATLLAIAEPRPLHRALKLSAAFGGANASLVLSREPQSRPARVHKPVFVQAGVHITHTDVATLSDLTGIARDRLARLDMLCKLGLCAVATLAAHVGRDTLIGAGIVAGHGLATLDTNDAFDARKRARGPTAVEPRAFPATSPNAVAGECAIAFKLTGPSFATGAGLDGATEALLDAAELVAAGDATAMVVVAADDAGPAARDLLAATGQADRLLTQGAVALLLTSHSGVPVDLESLPDHERSPVGHLALLPWIESAT
ncbi:MAG: 3-oxoacyl-ACP synthase [Polyangiaceae bacterium]|nr:3-oxoacyl-ACP synthase [Polyangiaceae bacterium]